MWRVEGKYRGFKISAIFLFALIFYITYYQRPSDGFLFLPGAFGLLLLPIFEISFFFFFNRKISPLSLFDRNAWMFKAWINSAPKMAYSACRQYSWKSLIPLKTSSAKELLVLLGYPYSARILLGIRRNFRPLGPYLYYFRKYKKEPRPNPIRLIGYLLCVAKL